MPRRPRVPVPLLAFVVLTCAAPASVRALPESAPTAVIQAPETVGYGLDISVSGSRSFDLDGSIARYIWTLDSQPPVTTTSPSVVLDVDAAHPLTVGAHIVRLVVEDDSGLQSAPDEVRVLVLDTVAPTAVLTAPSSVPFGAGITVSGSASLDVGGDIVAYSWTFDSQPPVETATPSITFAFDPAHPFTIGFHTVRLVVTDDSGNQSTPDSALVPVMDSLAPIAVISAPTTVPFGQDIVVSGSRSQDIGGRVTVYRWTLDGQAPVDSTEPDIVFHVDPASPLAVGTHTIQLVVFDGSGNQSDPTIAHVAIVDPMRPSAVITAPTTVPVGQSFVVSGSRSFDLDGTITRYTWTLDARPPVTTPNPSLTISVDPASPLPIGRHSLQLIVTDDQGNVSDPDQTALFVIDDIAPTAVIDAPQSVPFGQDIVVSGARSADVGGAIVRYQWTFDDQPSVESTDPSFTFSATPGQSFIPGRHVVRLVVTDNSGNQSEPTDAVVYVLDGSAPTAVITTRSIVGFGDDLVVSGERSFDIGGAVVRYEWRLDGGTPVITLVPAFTFAADPARPFAIGYHVVDLVVTDDSGVRSEPDTVRITVVDNIAPTAVIDAPTRIVEGSSLPVSGTRSFDIGGTIVRYDWQLDSQAPVSSAGPDLTFSDPRSLAVGLHTLRLVVTDDGGNTSEPVSALIVVEPRPDTTPPAVVLTAPADRAVYVLNEAVAALFECTDDLSGVASCVGTVSSGARLDTSTVGEKLFVVVATDAAGNTRREERRYSVVYANTGTCLIGPGHTILFPIDAGGGSRFWPGLPVAARFRVCDAGGRPDGTPGVVISFRLLRTIKDGVVMATDQPVPSLLQPPVFRWDPILKTWGYAIDTRTMTRGATHVFRIGLKDGSTIDFRFALR